MEESAELNENGLQDDLIGLHDFRDNLSVTRTQMCSFKVPTTATWSNGSCNKPATLFKTMWTRYELCGILEVSDDHLEPDRNPGDKKLEFYDERSCDALLTEADAKLHTTAVTGKKHRCSYGKRCACEQRAKCSPATEIKAQIHSHWMHREQWKQDEELQSP